MEMEERGVTYISRERERGILTRPDSFSLLILSIISVPTTI